MRDRRWPDVAARLAPRLLPVVAASVLAGCLPDPKPVDTSQLINGGVNIVPGEVLAAEKQHPSTAPTPATSYDLVDTILHSDQKQYHLVQLLRVSGLIPMLQQEGPYTIFAPNDAAFDKMPPGLLDRVLEPKHHDDLVRFLKYHILRGRVGFNDLLHTDGQVQTLLGPPTSPALGANSPARPMGTAVIIKGIDGKVMVNDANVIRTDTAASNGIIHWVDGVLIPPPALDAPPAAGESD
jgi:uncharacterized surface protein with fasciclin (FAS1) repeats